MSSCWLGPGRVAFRGHCPGCPAWPGAGIGESPRGKGHGAGGGRMTVSPPLPRGQSQESCGPDRPSPARSFPAEVSSTPPGSFPSRPAATPWWRRSIRIRPGWNRPAGRLGGRAVGRRCRSRGSGGHAARCAGPRCRTAGTPDLTRRPAAGLCGFLPLAIAACRPLGRHPALDRCGHGRRPGGQAGCAGPVPSWSAWVRRLVLRTRLDRSRDGSRRVGRGVGHRGDGDAGR